VLSLSGTQRFLGSTRIRKCFLSQISKSTCIL
jgi:hypothetical protein